MNAFIEWQQKLDIIHLKDAYNKIGKVLLLKTMSRYLNTRDMRINWLPYKSLLRKFCTDETKDIINKISTKCNSKPPHLEVLHDETMKKDYMERMYVLKELSTKKSDNL